MADSKSILTLAIVGVGAYVLYNMFSSSTSAAQGTAAPAGTTPTTPPPATGGGFVTLNSIYIRLQAAVSAGAPGYKASPTSYQASPYDYLFYLNQVMNVPSGLDFSKLFPNQVNPDGTNVSGATGVTLAQFWSAVAPWLQTNAGLTGGLGLAGLGSLRGYRR